MESQREQKESAMQNINSKLFDIDRMYAVNRLDLENKLIDLNKSLDEKQMELTTAHLKNKESESKLN